MLDWGRPTRAEIIKGFFAASALMNNINWGCQTDEMLIMLIVLKGLHKLIVQLDSS